MKKTLRNLLTFLPTVVALIGCFLILRNLSDHSKEEREQAEWEHHKAVEEFLKAVDAIVGAMRQVNGGGWITNVPHSNTPNTNAPFGSSTNAWAWSPGWAVPTNSEALRELIGRIDDSLNSRTGYVANATVTNLNRHGIYKAPHSDRYLSNLFGVLNSLPKSREEKPL